MTIIKEKLQTVHYNEFHNALISQSAYKNKEQLKSYANTLLLDFYFWDQTHNLI